MIVVDTTVLVYAVGDDHELAEPSRTLVQAIGDGSMQATTTAEVVQEFVHVRSRRRSRGDAARLGRAYAELLSPLLTVERGVLEQGLKLFERLPGLGAFDSVLASAALASGATGLVSADRAFAAVPRLRYFELGAPDLLDLVATR